MNDSIKVYSLPTCGMCKMLKRELENHNLSYENIQDTEQIQAAGIHSVPVMEINGQRYNFKEAINYLKGLK